MRTKWIWRNSGLLMVVLLIMGLLYIAWQQTRSRADEAARSTEQAQRATEQVPDFGKLCDALKGDKVIDKSASGPIWLYRNKFRLLESQSYSPVRAGVGGYTTSIFEAETLICVYDESEVIETCQYVYKPTGNPATTAHRSEVRTIVSLVDIQTKNKVNETSFLSKPPPCPSTLDFPQNFSGTPARDIIILDWVRQHWSP